MKRTRILLTLLATAILTPAQTPNAKGILLENLTWVQAEKVLTRDTVVVIPIGAASKEHGPHLRLKNDWILAEYLKNRVLRVSDVVIAPTVPCFTTLTSSRSPDRLKKQSASRKVELTPMRSRLR